VIAPRNVKNCDVCVRVPVLFLHTRRGVTLNVVMRIAGNQSRLLVQTVTTNYIVVRKNIPRVTGSNSGNANRSLKFVHCWRVYIICYKVRVTLSTTPCVCFCTVFGTQKNPNLLKLQRYSLKMISCVTKIKHYMSCG